MSPDRALTLIKLISSDSLCLELSRNDAYRLGRQLGKTSTVLKIIVTWAMYIHLSDVLNKNGIDPWVESLPAPDTIPVV